MNNTWNFQNTYTSLPDRYFFLQSPIPVPEPNMVLFNKELAIDLGLGALNNQLEETSAILAGNVVPEGAAPLAQAYAGHQFGHFNILGDGRAILLGEQITPAGERFDIQLKGAGQTPFSRRGDGRATLGSMLREYLISEAMHALGISTTRSLAVVKTGQAVYREVPHEGAILTRVAASHIRVGTFQLFRQFATQEEMKTFMDYVIARHYPEAKMAKNPALALLEAVMERQIDLIVDWMRVGFIHGVMNTDNMSIAGETIDYGPCAFMNAYDPKTVYSSIDTGGRYAFGNQPLIARWNLAVFAGTLIPMIDEDQEAAVALAQLKVDQFHNKFMEKWYAMMFKKLGITNPIEEDKELVNDILALLEANKADYTNFFYHLRFGSSGEETLYFTDSLPQWHEKWNNRISKKEAFQLMDATNPVFIPRNHLVEEAITAFVNGNKEPFIDLLDNLQRPYFDKNLDRKPQEIPTDFDACYQTFCGT